MKRILALTLILAMLLCGCAKKHTYTPDPATTVTESAAEETTEATTEPTTVPTTEPAPVYFNPLNGEILDEPYTGRIYASTISNIPDALPHVSVNEADILMECFVNGSIIRCLALFTDISDVEAIGSVRSTRLMFNDIVQHYDAILTHAGGSGFVLSDANSRGIDDFNIDAWAIASAGTSYRDKEYGRGYEHSLFGIGSGIIAYMESNGVRTTQPADKDYCLTFTEDGTPAGGEDAEKISVTFSYNRSKKETIMQYDADLGKYVYYQYGKMMTDQITEEPEAFENVIIMFADITTRFGSGANYHTADFVAGGEGYYACGGKIIPIKWTCDSEDSPFRFLTQSGEQLDLGMGNSYIAIAPIDSPVTYGAAETAE